MGNRAKFALGLSAFLLVACSTALPSLPEMPTLPSLSVPGLSNSPVPGDPACGGAWALDDGGGVAVTPAEEGLRWRSLDGQTGRFVLEKDIWSAYQGWTDTAETRQIQFTCSEGLTLFEGEAATKVPVTTQDIIFTGSKGTKLAGRLILPEGNDPVPVVLQVHGSERSSALLTDPYQHLLPLQGIGVFIYDKRGTGSSKGDYTQDFTLLAMDAVAAADEARRMAGPRMSRFGLHGTSQGGWVAPLAAVSLKPDFVIVSYGMLESPLAENRAESVLNVAEAGYGPSAQMAAGMLADAAATVMLSDFKRGYVELEALKKIYKDEPWYPLVQGEFTGDILRYPDYVLRVGGPLRSSGTSWRHEGEPVLRQLGAPVLWILAGADREAPPAYTRARLKALQYEGRPVTVAEFPGVDHGMREFTAMPDRSRRYSGYAPGYFDLVADFAAGREIAPGEYGDAKITPER
ncbi:alpha/beta hydrolase [Hyphomonas sp. WL0036]|uniref:alpha/beta hydrolase family protein n=1 Tax=Hyphomonas sediminis TaxID=2866160 RepID=UPI001C8089B8|nr:alpha/beta hydrolase [Hyphomonas sediminis]MBY9068065.1 alpha/beta hydrolase [Hyphomonas sediminis]